MNKPIIAIAGPTASGKSAVALALAKKVGGQIVSADSVQVYKRLDIGSAKPTAEEQKEVPHWLIDILDPWENYSAARFCDAAIDAINKIWAMGDVPILCGGTGFYLRSVLYDLDFGAVPPNEALRAELTQLDSQGIIDLIETKWLGTTVELKNVTLTAGAKTTTETTADTKTTESEEKATKTANTTNTANN